MPITRPRVYVAEGFLKDCDKLIQRCAQYGTLNYEKFCDVWKDMNFINFYHGRSSGAEIAELSEEVLHLAKHYIIVETHNFEETVAGLFLIYALLNLQPYENFAALRLTPGYVEAIHRLEATARQQRRCDVLFILGSVLIKGPCQFHAAQRERGMDIPIRKYLEGKILLENLGAMQKGVFYRQDEEFNLLKDLKYLGKSYSAAKAQIYGAKKDDRSLKYVKETFATELECSLKKLTTGGDEDDVEEDDAASTEVEKQVSLKERAMRNAVNPMKHLTGLQERKSNEKDGKSPVKKCVKGKVKGGSPTKAVANCSPKKTRKRRAPARKPRNTKRKITLKSSSEEVSSEEEQAELNLEEFQNNSPVEKTINQNVDEEEQKSLKCLDEEICTQLRSPKKLRGYLRKRNQKKSVIKSKFKRMGMLPVANFEEST